MRSSACIELIRYRIPEETTMILTFLHLIEKHKLGEQIFETVKTHLKTRGMTIRSQVHRCEGDARVRRR